MRQPAIEKLNYFYKKTFADLNAYIKHLGKIEAFVSINGYSLLINSSDLESDGSIKMDYNIGFNSTVVIPEILEDFSCSLLLFQNAFFKQSKQILRNTLELIVQFLYTDFLIKAGRITESEWAKRDKGVSRIFDIANELEKLPEYDTKTIREIKKVYNLLNASTHSHKNYLNTTATPRLAVNEVFGIDHTAVVDTKIIFLLCLQNTARLLVSFYKSLPHDALVDLLIKELRDLLLKMDIYAEDIENYKKGNFENGEGVLIFRKYMKLANGKDVLYTYKADRTIEYPSKIKGFQSEYKLIYQRIDEQLCQKK